MGICDYYVPVQYSRYVQLVIYIYISLCSDEEKCLFPQGMVYSLYTYRMQDILHAIGEQTQGLPMKKEDT